jgi:hypothetical protein
MKTLALGVLFAASLASPLALGHGEDKLGPNGGFIRMPGAFHTELVLKNANSLKVYLLDINWKNPSVKRSAIKVIHQASKATASCKTMSSFYVCQFPKNIDLTKKGELSVESKREDQTGMTVLYELPLQLQKVQGEGGHGSHH